MARPWSHHHARSATAGARNLERQERSDRRAVSTPELSRCGEREAGPQRALQASPASPDRRHPGVEPTCFT